MLKQQIQSDAISALKQGDSETAQVLRMTVAALAAKEKEKRYAISKKEQNLPEDELVKKSELSDDEALSVLSSEIKKRKDAIALYEQGNRPELAQKEKQEIDMLKKYLPEQLSADELQKLVEESIATTGAATMKDMGKVMADLNPKIKGKADGSEASKIVKELLGN
jgi:uncharacterized protein YqeY